MVEIFFIVLAVSMLLVAKLTAQISINASEFGIFPNDGKDDAVAITSALKDPRFDNGSDLVFIDGIYNLIEPDDSFNPLIDIKNRNRITLVGAKDSNGNPSTVFERNMSTPNIKYKSNNIISTYRCDNFSLKNILIQNNPEFSSSGVVKTVNKTDDYIEVGVFESLPHFNGMLTCSANAWNLANKELLPIDALTIGTDISKFPILKLVAGDNPRLYRAYGGNFASNLNPGDGMSWHFYVDNGSTQLNINQGSNICVENVCMTNSRMMSIDVQFCRNLTFRKVVLKPTGNQLAVGSRDAFHLICNTGSFLMEDCYIKGYRCDPMNIKSKICRVEEIVNSKTIKASVIIGYKPSVTMERDSVVLYTGDKPTEVRYVVSDKWASEKYTDLNGDQRFMVTIEFSENIPGSLSPGDAFGVYNWLFDDAVIRRCTFEGNFGRPILYHGHNLLVENCTFQNNAYASIALGPIDKGEGPFARNIKIRNNVFANSTWVSTTSHVHNGTIKIYENLNSGKEPYNCKNKAYNYNITIENNSFSGINYRDNYSAINVENASNVIIRNNEFSNNKSNVYINPATTIDINYVTHAGLYPENKTDFKIYPVKSSDGHLKVESTILVQKVRVYNVLGIVVKSITPNSNFFDVGLLSKGIYLIVIKTPEGRFIQKSLIL